MVGRARCQQQPMSYVVGATLILGMRTACTAGADAACFNAVPVLHVALSCPLLFHDGSQRLAGLGQ